MSHKEHAGAITSYVRRYNYIFGQMIFGELIFGQMSFGEMISAS